MKLMADARYIDTTVAPGNANPRGRTKKLINEEYATAEILNTGLFAQAASGRIAHNMYHGCTTGNNTTSTNVDTPNAPTG